MSAKPVPSHMPAAVKIANNNIACSVALHLPTSAGQQPSSLICGGGQLADDEVVWNKQIRKYLSPGVVQSLKVSSGSLTADHMHSQVEMADSKDSNGACACYALTWHYANAS